MENNNYKFEYKNDKFANFIGIKLLSLSKGKATATLEISSKMHNGINIAHGGAIFTLADLAFAAASNSHGIPAVSINATINYHTAVEDGILTAKALEIASNKKLATYSVEITDSKDQLIASFLGTVYKKHIKHS